MCKSVPNPSRLSSMRILTALSCLLALGMGPLNVPAANGGQDPEIARLFQEGMALANADSVVENRRGLVKLDQALTYFMENKNGRATAEALEIIGLTHLKLAQEDQALRPLERALNQFMAIADLNSVERVTEQVSRLYWSSGEKAKTLALHDRLAEFFRGQGDVFREGRTFSLKATLQSHFGDIEPAFAELRKAYDLAERNGNKPLLLEARKAEILIHHKNGDYRETLAVIDKILADTDAPMDPQLSIFVHNAAGSCYRYLGEPFKALESIRLVIENPIQNELTATCMLNKAEIYHSFGDRRQALEHYNDALNLYRKLNQSNGEASAMDRLGLVLMQMGDLDPSLDFLKRSNELFTRLKNIKGQAYSLTHIGNNYQRRGDLDTALSYHHQALELADQAQHGWRTLMLHDLGTVHHQAGALEEAECYFQEALAMQRARGVQSEEAETLKQLATIYLDMKDFQRASYYLDLALNMFHALENRQGEALSLHVAARLAAAEGNLNEAIALNEDALGMIESLRAKIGGLGLRTSYFEIIHSVYMFGVDAMMMAAERDNEGDYAAAALEICERARARTLLEFMNEKPRESASDDLAARKTRLQRRLSAKLNYLTELPDTSRNREERERVRRDLDTILADYRVVESQLGEHNLVGSRPLSTAEIQEQVLAPNVLLLEYALGEERSYLWCVDQTRVRAYELPGISVVEGEAQRFFNLLTERNKRVKFETRAERDRRVAAADAKLDGAAADLGRLLFGPVIDQLKDQRLLIVGDGVLLNLPFGILPKPNGKTHRPLLMDHVVVNAASATVVNELKKRRSCRERAPKSLAVFADPVFSDADPRLKHANKPTSGSGSAGFGRDLSTDQPRLPRLPGTRTEAVRLLKLVPPDESYKAMGFEATFEAAMDPDITNYRMVHFATHGVINSKYPELSGLVLSMVDPSGQGLDGVVKLQDIHNMKLKADLVVMSACETALGKHVRGEGLLGLTQSFMYAGVPRVVASLWNIQDQATSELMVLFYRGILKDGATPSEALRQAQITLMKHPKWSAPYYWGGFVLQGLW